MSADRGVCLEIQDGRGWVKTHSAKATNNVVGDTDWVYVTADYKTLDDAKDITVIVRRVSGKGAISGKCVLKDIQVHKVIPENKFGAVPYLSVNASKSEDGETVYLMVVNKNLDEDEETEIVLTDFEPSGVARVYTLWGKTIDATNEKRPHNDVRIYEDTIKFKGNSFKYKFKKHSLTAIEIKRKIEKNEK